MIILEKVDWLPNIPTAMSVSQSLAMLDAILSPDWQFRYYSFDCAWAKDEMVASMRNGSGDHYFILFRGTEAILKSFTHERPSGAELSSKVIDALHAVVPKKFAQFLREPAFALSEISLLAWCSRNDYSWTSVDVQKANGKSVKKSLDLFTLLCGGANDYKQWAAEYYERSVDLEATDAVFRHVPLSVLHVQRLNPRLSLGDLVAECAKIGYPIEP